MSAASLKILISYRREDSAGYAGRLYDDLTERVGQGRVFIDIDAIEPGLDFTEVIEREVGTADVVLVIIGRRWVGIEDSAGRRRLENPSDYHRLEIEAALERNIRVIPILVQDAVMPSIDELPESIARLAHRNALELSDRRWSYDLGRLSDALDRIGELQAPPEPEPRPEAEPEPEPQTEPPPPPPASDALVPPPPVPAWAPPPQVPTGARRRLLPILIAGGLAVAVIAGVVIWQIARPDGSPRDPDGGSGAGGMIVIRLIWSAPPSDLDLYVTPPGSERIELGESIGTATHGGDVTTGGEERVTITLSDPSSAWAGVYGILVRNRSCEIQFTDSDSHIVIETPDGELVDTISPGVGGEDWLVGTLTIDEAGEASFSESRETEGECTAEEG